MHDDFEFVQIRLPMKYLSKCTVDKANLTPLWNITFLLTFKGLPLWKYLITQRLGKELDVADENFTNKSFFVGKYPKNCNVSKLQCHEPGHKFT